ncbi:MAG: hypothetical protein QM778_15315 [Myxococcales bacterium]
MSRPITAWLGSLVALSGCVQSDVVARERISAGCLDEDCSCRATLCPDAHAARDMFCASSGFVGLSGDSCEPNQLTARAHRYALCSCSDYTAGGSLHVDAFRGSPTDTLTNAGDVGVNGDFNAGADVSIGGALRLSGQVTSEASQPLSTGAGVEQSPTPPCDCADPDQLAMPDLVSQVRADNDNQSIGLAVRQLDGVSNPAPLTLPCGRYFLSRIASPDPVRIHVTGRALLVVESNIELDSSFEIEVDPGASIELFIAGTMRVNGELTLGDVARGESSLRLHLAGEGSLNLQGNATIAGVLDAPRAELVTGQALTVYGALLVRRAAPEANLVVHYDAALASAGGCGE